MSEPFEQIHSTFGACQSKQFLIYRICKPWEPQVSRIILNWDWLWRRLRKQWCCNLCWKSRDRPRHFFFSSFTQQLNISTGTFLLVSCFSTFQNLLWFVPARSRQTMLTKTYSKASYSGRMAGFRCRACGMKNRKIINFLTWCFIK